MKRSMSVVTILIVALGSVVVGYVAGVLLSTHKWPALQSWQPLIAACIAGFFASVAALVAYQNVKKQVSVSVLSREEERIERMMPVSQQLWVMASHLSFKLQEDLNAPLLPILQAQELHITRERMFPEIKKRFEHLDGPTAFQLAECLNWLVHIAEMSHEEFLALKSAKEAVANADDPQEAENAAQVLASAESKLEFARKMISEQAEELERISSRMEDRNLLWTEQLPKIRAVLDQYVDRAIARAKPIPWKAPWED